MKREAGHPTRRTALLPVMGLVLACATTRASEIGQQVANQVNVATYRYYLDGRLYTHDGDDRGAGGFLWGTYWYDQGIEHDRARDAIAEALAGCGLNVALEQVGTSGEYYNVVATQVGSVYPDSYFVIGAHYDSIAWIYPPGYPVGNPGADDNASGAAAVLEIARVLSLYGSAYTIKYIAFDVEETGMDGSSAYVQDHLTDDIRGMVSLDMIAWDNGEYRCEIRGRTQSDPVKLALADAINLYGNGLSATVGGQSDNSDHAPFEWEGFQACLLIEWSHGYNPCYHELCDSVDTPDYINYDFAANMVRSTAGFLAEQAGAQALFDCDTGAGCEPGGPAGEDCNANGVGDLCDVFCGAAADCNGNHVPDECEPDCNGNGVPDDCDAAAGTSADENRNLVPDECEAAQTLYVDDDAPGDPGPGDPVTSDPLEDGSPEHPFDGIREAIRSAKSGDLVLVRPGVYSGRGNRDLDFGGRLITVQGETGPQACIIDCEQDGRGFYFHSGENTLAVVAGLTITNGWVTPESGAAGGGGIACVGASPTISGCVIAGNAAMNYVKGGGIYCLDGANPMIAGCVITGNEAQEGSGVFAEQANPTITGCTIAGNIENGVVCWSSNATIANCLIVGNGDGEWHGEGVWCDFSDSTTLANCTIASNGGSGLVCSESSPTITNCVLWGDASPEIDLYSGNPAVTFCDIAGGWPGTGNIAADPVFAGGPIGLWTADAIYDPATYLVTFTDSTAAWPAGSLVGKLIRPDTTMHLQYPIVANTDTTIAVWYNFFYPPSWITSGTEYQINDYHLLPDSPCVGAGDPDGDYAGQTDIDGDPRVLFGRVDIGADEVTAFTDCNGNGVPDSIDITAGTSEDCTGNGIPDECEADCNGNGVADSCDVLAGTSPDCDGSGVPDECETHPDCNGNGIADECDIIQGYSFDCDGNGVPDECEPHADCNANGVPDECDVAGWTSTDVNQNLIPDECEGVGDLNCDGVTDFADINPFVLFLSNYAAWQTAFPGCDPVNGDINGDGTYGQWALDDVNPFVFLLAGE